MGLLLSLLRFLVGSHTSSLLAIFLHPLAISQSVTQITQFRLESLLAKTVDSLSVLLNRGMCKVKCVLLKREVSWELSSRDRV